MAERTDGRTDMKVKTVIYLDECFLVPKVNVGPLKNLVAFIVTLTSSIPICLEKEQIYSVSGAFIVAFEMNQH